MGHTHTHSPTLAKLKRPGRFQPGPPRPPPHVQQMQFPTSSRNISTSRLSQKGQALSLVLPRNVLDYQHRRAGPLNTGLDCCQPSPDRVNRQSGHTLPPSPHTFAAVGHTPTEAMGKTKAHAAKSEIFGRAQRTTPGRTLCTSPESGPAYAQVAPGTLRHGSSGWEHLGAIVEATPCTNIRMASSLFPSPCINSVLGSYAGN